MLGHGRALLGGHPPHPPVPRAGFSLRHRGLQRPGEEPDGDLDPVMPRPGEAP